MKTRGRPMACGLAAIVLMTGNASAGQLYRRYHVSHHRQLVAPGPYAGYGNAPQPAPGAWTSNAEIVRQATARAYREPGTTLELAPDAKETATGGPVGGVPGFDGS